MKNYLIWLLIIFYVCQFLYILFYFLFSEILHWEHIALSVGVCLGLLNSFSLFMFPSLLLCRSLYLPLSISPFILPLSLALPLARSPVYDCQLVALRCANSFTTFCCRRRRTPRSLSVFFFPLCLSPSLSYSCLFLLWFSVIVVCCCCLCILAEKLALIKMRARSFAIRSKKFLPRISLRFFIVVVVVVVVV